jgi:TfoX/Sxy family transcriptional regulator of competence genes
MPFDNHVSHRLREILSGEVMDSEGVTIKDRRMFGGLAIIVNGHMCCGVVGRKLVVRVGRNEYEQALSQPHAHHMDFTGRAMLGFVYVDPAGFRSNTQLRVWIRRSLDFVLSLPPK